MNYGYHIHIFSLAEDREYALNPSGGGSNPVLFGQTIVWNGQPAPDAPGGIWVTRIGDI
jgi:hypothetical protein